MPEVWGEARELAFPGEADAAGLGTTLGETLH